MEYFNRAGQVVTAKVEGKKASYTYTKVCHRCGGLGGGEQWRHTGWTCFECGGSGTLGTRTAPAYTRAQLDALIARADKAAAKKAEKEAIIAEIKANEQRMRVANFRTEHTELVADLEKYASKNMFLGGMLENIAKYGKLSVAQIDAAQNIITTFKMKELEQNNFLGTIGEKIELTITVKKVIDIGYGSFPRIDRWMFICADAVGNCVVYKGTAKVIPNAGETVSIVATVKEHTEYNGKNQTIIERPKAVK